MKYKKEYLQKILDKAANPTEEIHEIYKNSLKSIIFDALINFLVEFESWDLDEEDYEEMVKAWISDYVEQIVENP